MEKAQSSKLKAQSSKLKAQSSHYLINIFLETTRQNLLNAV